MSPAGLFGLIWGNLADLLGTAATAALLRRALKRAEGACPELNRVVIGLNGLSYSCRLPDSWDDPKDREGLIALRALAVELRVLLVDLAGPVVVRRLARLTCFQEHGIDFAEREPPA